MIAVVFVWVVDTRKPGERGEHKTENVAHRQRTPEGFQLLTMSTPTLLMMRSPPTAVPNHMLSAQKNINQMGRTI